MPVSSSSFAVHARAGGLAAGRPVEHEDAEPPGVEGGAGAGRTRRLERVGVVRHEHDRGVSVCAAALVDELQAGSRRAGAEHVRGGLRERARLGVAVRLLPHGVAVDPERHVVEEEAPVHLGHVDPPLDGVGEGVERADEIAAVDADVEREVVAGAGGNADERKHVREASCGHNRERAVASGDSEGVRAVRDRLVDERRKAVPGAEDDHVDAALSRALGEAGARRLAAAGPRVDEQHGPLRPIGGARLPALRVGVGPGRVHRRSLILGVRSTRA